MMDFKTRRHCGLKLILILLIVPQIGIAAFLSFNETTTTKVTSPVANLKSLFKGKNIPPETMKMMEAQMAAMKSQPPQTQEKSKVFIHGHKMATQQGKTVSIFDAKLLSLTVVDHSKKKYHIYENVHLFARAETHKASFKFTAQSAGKTSKVSGNRCEVYKVKTTYRFEDPQLAPMKDAFNSTGQYCFMNQTPEAWTHLSKIMQKNLIAKKMKFEIAPIFMDRLTLRKTMTSSFKLPTNPDGKSVGAGFGSSSSSFTSVVTGLSTREFNTRIFAVPKSYQKVPPPKQDYKGA